MRTCTYQSVLWGIARALGLNPAQDLNSNLNNTRAGTLTEYLNQRVSEGWRFAWWPEWVVTEPRYYRAPYLATENVTAATERYHYGSQGYYQALRAQTPAAQAPATYAGGVWTENSAYWALSRASYVGAVDWETGQVLTVGEQRRDPLTGLYYQVHTAHTAGATIDLTKLGLLTPFAKTLSLDQTGETPIGETRPGMVSSRDPRVFPDRPGELGFVVTREGLLLSPSAPNAVYVTFRKRPPEFTATAHAAGAAYTAGLLRYWAATGECYRSRSASAGTPDDPPNATYWEKQDFPLILAGFVKRAAASDALRDQKQTDRARDQLAQALEELSDTRERELGSQGQEDTIAVATYGS